MLIKRIRKVSPKTAFIFETNNDSFRKVRKRKYVQHPNGEVARKSFFMLADKHKAGVWDKFSIMGGLGSMAKWEKADLAKKDKVHFKTAGYQLLGDMFYKALMQAYFDHIANLPAEDPVEVQTAKANAAAQAATPQALNTSTIAQQVAPKSVKDSPMKNSPMQATVASARKTKAEMPMPKVLKQAAKDTQQKIQIPLKPDAQPTEKK